MAKATDITRIDQAVALIIEDALERPRAKKDQVAAIYTALCEVSNEINWLLAELRQSERNNRQT